MLHHILVDFIHRCILPGLIFFYDEALKKREFMNELMVLFYPTNIYFSPWSTHTCAQNEGLAPYRILYSLAIIGISQTKRNLPCRPHKIGYLPRCDMTILLNTFPKTTERTWQCFFGRIWTAKRKKKIEKVEPWNTALLPTICTREVLSQFTFRDTKPKSCCRPKDTQIVSDTESNRKEKLVQHPSLSSPSHLFVHILNLNYKSWCP